MRQRDGDQGATLRPRRSLFTRGVLAVLLLTTPVFAVVYWLTASTRGWTIVLIVHLAVVALAVWAVQQYFRTFIRLTPGGVTEQGFLGPAHHVASAHVASALLLEVYEGSSLETVPQLFVLDRSDRCVLRMRGRFWSPADMDRAVEHLGVPVERRPEPVTMAQLRSTSPRLLYWFERGVGRRSPRADRRSG